jgi:hypothetical protein
VEEETLLPKGGGGGIFPSIGGGGGTSNIPTAVGPGINEESGIEPNFFSKLPQ